MRTTLTLDPDVARRLKARMAEEAVSLKQAVNDALRAGLDAGAIRRRKSKFVVEPHACRFKAGIDLDRINQLIDELDSEASLRSLSQ